ncbi:MAG: hypothetical protein ABIO79_05115 [Ferruginibacter sp.]
MKKAIPTIALLCITMIFLSSCGTGKNSFEVCRMVPVNAKVEPAVCYIQLNDGTVQNYSSLKLVTGVLVTPHLLADNRIIIHAKDIKAYKNDQHYAVSSNSLKTVKTGYVAVETLPGFAVRLVQGKLNVYCRKFYNGSNSVDEYFLQTGNDGEIIAYSAKTMKELLKDNPKALDYYNSKVKVSPKSKKLMATAVIYNTGELLSKN